MKDDDVQGSEADEEVVAIAASTAMQESDKIILKPRTGFSQCVFCAHGPKRCVCDLCPIMNKYRKNNLSAEKEVTDSKNLYFQRFNPLVRTHPRPNSQ